MHPPEVRAQIKALIAEGVNDCEISRRTAVPRSTVRDIRRPSYHRRTPIGPPCPRCWRPGRAVFCDEDYAELLGLYLGDGCISPAGRTERLRIHLDGKYPKIIREARDLLARSFPENAVGVQQVYDGRMAVVYVYSQHLICLFPQHGPGPKHQRAIQLEPWQERIVRAAPWPFLRGCFRSDGCAYINRTGPYEYLSHDFTNVSDDIRRLFCDACDRVGVEYRAYARRVRINRRASVALMLERVGIKA